MGIDHRGLHVAVPQQFLDGADVLATLQQVSRKQVAERVTAGRLADSGPQDRQLHGLLDQGWVEALPALRSDLVVTPTVRLWKDPLPPPFRGGVQVLPSQRHRQHHPQMLLQGLHKAGWKHGEPVLVAFVTADGPLPDLNVHILYPEQQGCHRASVPQAVRFPGAVAAPPSSPPPWTPPATVWAAWRAAPRPDCPHHLHHRARGGVGIGGIDPAFRAEMSGPGPLVGHVVAMAEQDPAHPAQGLDPAGHRRRVG